MRTQGGGGSKNGQILRTSFMDGPLVKINIIVKKFIKNHILDSIELFTSRSDTPFKLSCSGSVLEFSDNVSKQAAACQNNDFLQKNVWGNRNDKLSNGLQLNEKMKYERLHIFSYQKYMISKRIEFAHCCALRLHQWYGSRICFWSF